MHWPFIKTIGLFMRLDYSSVLFFFALFSQEPTVLTNREASKALDNLKDYAIAKELPEMLKNLNLAESCQPDYMISAKKQTLVTDFFDKI
jgi:hypothetical protein